MVVDEGGPDYFGGSVVVVGALLEILYAWHDVIFVNEFGRKGGEDDEEEAEETLEGEFVAGP